jgi:UDP-N-acetylmuramyl pentapeptide synthase
VSHKDHIEYLLTTVDGKVIKKDKFMERYKIDTKKLASGTYFLIIKDKDQSESFKIIKK